jgi:hypothetical protein
MPIDLSRVTRFKGDDIRMKNFLILICACMFTSGTVLAQKMDSASAASIVKALQEQVRENPSVFPLESYEGGVQSLEKGLRLTYFGYGERRYSHRFDFHPAMDVGYFPTEIGNIEDETGETWEVRAPQTYLKKVYAIQKGELVSIRLLSSGYKLMLKHELKTPYYDNNGRAYYHYYTCYRHLDSRSLSYLNGVAKEFTNDSAATYKALFGKYTFEAGEQVALVGFPPDEKAVEIPRAHLDFSLNLFKDPNKGTNIRNYAMNPLLLFPPFEYANPRSYEIGANHLPAYKFVVHESHTRAPSKKKHGAVVFQIHSGGLSADGEYLVSRYFALNGLKVVLINDGKQLGTYRLDRHGKLGYDTKSYESLDNPNQSVPYFLPPLGEQGDIFNMGVVLPTTWFEEKKYDWSKDGSVSIQISSIWDGYLEGHSHSLTIPLSAE